MLFFVASGHGVSLTEPERSGMATPVRDLPLEERLALVEDIWDSIAAEQEQLPLTPDQWKELDRRLDEFEVDSEPGDFAGDVVTRIRKGL